MNGKSNSEQKREMLEVPQYWKAQKTDMKTGGTE
jgi:hypothetical protein